MRMMPFVAITFLLAVLAVLPAVAADNAAVGKWQCVSNARGDDMPLTLVVKEEGGALTGTLAGGFGEFAIKEAKLTGSDFSFKVEIGDVTYTVQTKIEGDKLAGNWKGETAEGTIKGQKQP